MHAPRPTPAEPAVLRLLAAVACVAAVLALAAVVAVNPGPPPPAGVQDARARALHWVGDGTVEEAVREGAGWEVDVRRRDGSVVEVEVDDELRLLGIDEEVGPGGGPAHDELGGPQRARAVRAALSVIGTAQVQSVERDHSGEIEVDVIRTDGTRLEAELDEGFRVVEVERD